MRKTGLCIIWKSGTPLHTLFSNKTTRGHFWSEFKNMQCNTVDVNEKHTVLGFSNRYLCVSVTLPTSLVQELAKAATKARKQR